MCEHIVLLTVNLIAIALLLLFIVATTLTAYNAFHAWMFTRERSAFIGGIVFASLSTGAAVLFFNLKTVC